MIRTLAISTFLGAAVLPAPATPGSRSPSSCRYGPLQATPALPSAMESSCPFPRQRHHRCRQRRGIDRACDPKLHSARKRDLDRPASSSVNHPCRLLRRNRDCRKLQIALRPQCRCGPEGTCSRLSPPNGQQIGMHIVPPRHLNDAGPRRQALFHHATLLGRRPPPPSLRTRKNRNLAHVCSFAGKSISKLSQPSSPPGRRSSPASPDAYH